MIFILKTFQQSDMWRSCHRNNGENDSISPFIESGKASVNGGLLKRTVKEKGKGGIGLNLRISGVEQYP